MNDEVLGIIISNPNKIIYPKGKITKLEVAQYYAKVASRMMPHIDKRLLSVIRCHTNIDGEKFYKKHPTTESNFVGSFMVGNDEYFHVRNAQELVFQAQMGTLEFHTWGSKINSIDKPDLMVFDLDPSEDVSLQKLRLGVMNLKSVLDELKLNSFLKTSGGKGYHIVVPFSRSKDWESFSEFSKEVALLLEARWPKLYTSNIRKAERKGRIFVDYLRNKKTATCVAPYSLRARENAPVSFPLNWSQIDEIAPNGINISNIDKHLSLPDPWRSMFSEKQFLR